MARSARMASFGTEQYVLNIVHWLGY